MKTTLKRIMMDVWPNHDVDHLEQLRKSLLFNGKAIADINETIEVKTGDKVALPGSTFIYIYSFNEEVAAKKDIFRGNNNRKVVVDIPKNLTLENFQEKMGQRFKMTKDESKRYNELPRKEARQKAFEARYALHRT